MRSDTVRNGRNGRDRIVAVYRMPLPIAMTSDAAVQSAAIQKALRIEHFFDLLHHRKIVPWLRPQLCIGETAALAKILGRKLHHAGAYRWMPQFGGIVEVAITHSRARASQCV